MNSRENYEYVDEDEQFICGLCNKMFDVPVVTTCGHTFCSHCIREHLSNNSTCPSPRCLQQLSTKDFTTASTLVLNMMNKLLVKCNLCQQTLMKGMFGDHIENNCPQASVKCNAMDIRCLWEGKREQLTSHLETCAFYQLKPVLSELMESNQQQKSRIEQLKEQMDVNVRTYEERCALLENQIQQQQTQYQNLQKMSTLKDQPYEELKTAIIKIQEETRSQQDAAKLICAKLETQTNQLNSYYQNQKAEIKALIDQNHSRLNVTMSEIQSGSQSEYNAVKVTSEHLKVQIANVKKEILELKRDIYNLKDNSAFRTALPKVPSNVVWTRNAHCIAGGHEFGETLEQLYQPHGLYVNNNQTVYIADSANHRIVKWSRGAEIGEVIVGGHGSGIGLNQLNYPTDVIVDNEILIICDSQNRRVLQWNRRDDQRGTVLLTNIDCYGLTMDDEKSLYVSDTKMHRVIRYRPKQKEIVIIAGNGKQGAGDDELDDPRHVFVDREHSVYVSDCNNHRVMKWPKNAKKGIVVAGGRGHGNSLTQLHSPQGLFVDSSGNVYVADLGNNRVMCWHKGARSGIVVVGDDNQEEQAIQLSHPTGLALDQNNSLYVAESENHRVQRFSIDNRN